MMRSSPAEWRAGHFYPTCYGLPSGSTVQAATAPRRIGVMARGVWIYEPRAHAVLPHLMDDIRRQTGLQDFVGTAPLNLIYVARAGNRRG